MPDFVRVEGVELMTVGMEWPTTPAPVTLTAEHLADIVAAANDDPHVVSPRLRLGHTSPLNGDMPTYDPFAAIGDGEPAFGTAVDLRLDNDGAVVVCDFEAVPRWLADVLPSAYPTRSCEWVWNVVTPGGKRYSAVLTAVALGGAWTPAVQDLEDLERALTEGLTFDPDPAAAVVARSTGGTVPTSAVSASADIDTVRARFWVDFAQGDRYWWWPRAIWTDPNEIIADDDEGHVFRVPFASDADGNVTFGDPTPVRQTFVDVPEPVSAAAAAPQRQHDPALSYASAAAARPDGRRTRPTRTTEAAEAVAAAHTAAQGAADTQEATTMDVDTTLLRQRLGLPDDATEEQITEALQAPDDTVETTDVEVTGEREIPAADAEDREPVAASIDPDALARLQADAAAGRAARDEQVRRERDDLVAAAVADGRIAPARRDEWRENLDRDPGAAATLASLTPVLPVQERGHGATDDAAGEEQVVAGLMAAAYGITTPTRQEV